MTKYYTTYKKTYYTYCKTYDYKLDAICLKFRYYITKQYTLYNC